MTFDDAELYPTLAEKASALGFSLIENHPFLASVDEQVAIMLGVASGTAGREALTAWLREHITPR